MSQFIFCSNFFIDKFFFKKKISKNKFMFLCFGQILNKIVFLFDNKIFKKHIYLKKFTLKFGNLSYFENLIFDLLFLQFFLKLLLYLKHMLFIGIILFIITSRY